eukprot:6192200-Pleurochrysis_carterae.AAC.2
MPARLHRGPSLIELQIPTVFAAQLDRLRPLDSLNLGFWRQVWPAARAGGRLTACTENQRHCSAHDFLNELRHGCCVRCDLRNLRRQCVQLCMRALRDPTVWNSYPLRLHIPQEARFSSWLVHQSCTSTSF